MNGKGNVVNLDREPNMNVFDTAKIDKVFVYGTLKQGKLRGGILKDCKYECQDALHGYLFDIGTYPAYIPDDVGTFVNGEVYTLPSGQGGADLLEYLDNIEGINNLYYRYAFRTFAGHFAWAYWMPRDRIQAHWVVITDGHWQGPYKNNIMLFNDYLREHKDRRWPAKLRSTYQKETDCPVADLYAKGDGGQIYLPVSESESRAMAQINFSTIPSIPTKSNVAKLSDYRLVGEKKPEAAKPKDPPKLVETVWLHKPGEEETPATKQEVGGI